MLRIVINTVLPAVLGFGLLQCSSSPKEKSQVLREVTGDYQYTGYDKAGSKIVEGELSFKIVSPEQIKGEWQLKAIGNPERVGPQVGTGRFTGELKQNKISINLNPNMADNNVYLSAKIDKASFFKGTWSYSGFAGVINQGTFEAKRKRS